MTSRFLLDEHLPPWWTSALSKRQPGLTVWRVGNPGAPPLATPDPVILEWCEVRDFVLVTNNRVSMPGHLADHLAAGRHVPGILTVDPSIPTNDLADELALIAGAARDEEYRDQIRFVPVT